MTTPDPAKRPRQATMAGWMVVLGSIFAVVTAFEVVGGARSLNTREAIEQFLSEPPGSAMGLGVEEVVTLLQGVATAAAVIAAMTAVLGFYALRGDRRARLVLAVLAVPLFLTGMAIGGFLTSLVAAACALLFLSPSREWFDGKPIPESSWGSPGGQAQRSQSGAGQSVAGQPGADESGGTPPGPVAGTPPNQPAGQPPSQPYGAPYSSPYATATQAPWAGAGPQQGRPPSVTVAVALTLVMSSLVLLLSVVGLVAVLAAPDLMIDEMLRTQPDLLDQGMTRELIVVTALTTAVVMVLACLSAIGFAIALLTGRKWGATGLVVMSVLTVVFCMVAAISSLVALVPGVAALLVLTNVRQREARAWVR